MTVTLGEFLEHFVSVSTYTRVPDSEKFVRHPFMLINPPNKNHSAVNLIVAWLNVVEPACPLGNYELKTTQNLHVPGP